MTHKEITAITKQQLADSLKRFMEKKPLSKISISELCSDCHINRKTFYYHFEDVSSLMKWILEEETIKVIKQYDLTVDYRQAIGYVIDYTTANQHILQCAYDSLGRDELRKFFNNAFRSMFLSVIPQAEQILGIKINPEFGDFICDFYTQALSGKLIDLFQSRQEFDKEKLLAYVSIMLGDAMPIAFQKATEINI